MEQVGQLYLAFPFSKASLLRAFESLLAYISTVVSYSRKILPLFVTGLDRTRGPRVLHPHLQRLLRLPHVHRRHLLSHLWRWGLLQGNCPLRTIFARNFEVYLWTLVYRFMCTDEDHLWVHFCNEFFWLLVHSCLWNIICQYIFGLISSSYKMFCQIFVSEDH
jgi:hypothetical protein